MTSQIALPTAIAKTGKDAASLIGNICSSRSTPRFESGLHASGIGIQDTTMTSSTMKCALIKSHGDDIDELLMMTNTYPKPTFPTNKRQQQLHNNRERELLIKVHACALAPGDIRVMKGHCDLFQSPPEGFPYIPGGDIAGVVEEVLSSSDDDSSTSSTSSSKSRFKIGDRVVSMFDLPRPVHGLAQYVIVKESNTEIIPDSIDFRDAACVTSSAVAAYSASSKHVHPGSRVLILGGNGGVGTFLIQFSKRIQNASFVAVTSSTEGEHKDRLLSLGADRIVDYTKQLWYEDIPEFEDDPFDVIFDLGVGKKQAWVAARSYTSLLKPSSGKYITFSGHNPEMKVHNAWQAIGFMAVLYSRMIGTACNPLTPKYIWHNGLDIQEGITLKKILQLVDEGKIEVVLDPISPLPFTIDGIRQGFHLMNCRHAHGKVVVQIVPEYPQE